MATGDFLFPSLTSSSRKSLSGVLIVTRLELSGGVSNKSEHKTVWACPLKHHGAEVKGTVLIAFMH
jgi:hypothetical protein